MLDRMLETGVRESVLTPHFYADREAPDTFLTRRDAAMERLRSVLRPDDLTLYVGAEVAYYDGIGASQAVEKLCICGTTCLLLELPFDTWHENVYLDMERLQRRGFCTVIAHAERYPDFRHKAVRRRLRAMGLLVQSNADALLQHSAQRRSIRRVANGEVDLLGSDCHHAGWRPPNLAAAVGVLIQHGLETRVSGMMELSRALLATAVPL